jgi:hypothetical protein
MMARPSILAAAALLALALAVPAAATAFGVEVGEPVPDDELAVLGGGKAHLLGATRVSVFVFFRTGQDHSLDALTRLARLEKELAGKPVRFVAVASGDEAPAEVRKVVQQAGIQMPVLLDRGDVLYGKLGVRLHPVIGIVDDGHRLAAYEHFRKVNLEARVLAQVRALLGEIGRSELAQVLDPPAAPVDESDAVKAGLQARFARKLLEAGQVDQAMAMAKAAAERAPQAPEPHAVLAEVLTARGDCAGAAKEQQLARAAQAKGAVLASASLRPCPAQ